jgi:hypothetical protein
VVDTPRAGSGIIRPMQQTSFTFDYAAPDVSQFWRLGRNGFRVYGERINPLEYEVVHAASHREARAFVEREHYEHSWPSAVEVFELRRRGRLVGAAIFSVPGGPAVLGAWFPDHAHESAELGRLVLSEEVPGDGETWFLARCFELLRREGYFGVLSFSDPMPRYRLDDPEPVMPGHVGRIYMAFNGVYLERSRPETVWMFGDGTLFPSRSRTKVRAYARATTDEALEQAKGWRYAVDDLLAHGAAPFAFEPGDPGAAAWVDAQLADLSRCYRAPGKYRFAWGLRQSAKNMLRRKVAELGHPKHPRVIIPGKPHVIRRGRAGALLEVAA